MKKKKNTKKTFAGYEKPQAEPAGLDLIQSIMVGSTVDGPESYDDQVINVEDLFQ